MIALLQAAAAQADYRDSLLISVSYAVPYAVTGAFLLARRPDLPFGWLLAGAAASQVLMLATVGPAALAVRAGHAGVLAELGLSMGNLGFVPIAVQGLVNVRFPSGRPATRKGRRLERALVAGTGLGSSAASSATTCCGRPPPAGLYATR